MSFFEEMLEQPDCVRNLVYEIKRSNGEKARRIQDMIERVRPNQYIFTGMGSSLFASHIPCSYLRRKGIRAFALEANELQAIDAAIIDEHTVLIAVSQSGNSLETVRFCEKYEERPLIIVTNQESGNLAEYGDVQLFIHAGDEYSTATKSYTNTIVALMYLAYVISGQGQTELDALFAELNRSADVMECMTRDMALAEKLADFLAERPVKTLVGSGASYSTVKHGQLVFLEAARELVANYTVGQFIHGPVEVINDKFVSIMFDFNPAVRKDLENVMQLTEKYCGKTLLFTNRTDIEGNDQRLTVPIDCENEFISPLLEVIPVELLVYVMGNRKGCHPGELHRVHK